MQQVTRRAIVIHAFQPNPAKCRCVDFIAIGSGLTIGSLGEAGLNESANKSRPV
jgi:hypothetical protein